MTKKKTWTYQNSFTIHTFPSVMLLCSTSHTIHTFPSVMLLCSTSHTIHTFPSIMLLCSTSHTIHTFPSVMLTMFHLPHCTHILNMTWYMRCRIKLKQLDEHLFYILICALAKKLNFSLIVTSYQHKYYIFLKLCIYYLFLYVFYLRCIQFLRQYSPYPVPLTLSCVYVYTSRNVVCYGWVLFACSYYCCFLFQI